MKRGIVDIVSALTIVGSMVLSAAVPTLLVQLGLAIGPWRWYHWLLVSPVLYFSWLVAYLWISAALCRQMGQRHPKPRHMVFQPSRGVSKDVPGIITAIVCYRRLAILQTIPFVAVVSQFRYLDRLVLRSYSPAVHIGEMVMNMGRLYDPDLTDIGNNVVLGGNSTIVAHAMAVRGDGALAYVSAPVKIGARATIGGEARVTLGCVIGEDAVVELGSLVEPFTEIPAGEVWGGNPARFRRKRDDVDVGDLVPAREVSSRQAAVASSIFQEAGAPPVKQVEPREIRQLVVEALNLTSDEAAGELSSETCAMWDSLGQIGIASAIFHRYGVTVEGSEVFRLRTLADVAAVVSGGSAAPNAFAPVRVAEQEAGALPTDLEMLPLLDSQEATRALAAGLDRRALSTQPLVVEIVASFTAQGIGQTLKLWGKAFGMEIDCRFAGYDQIVQALLGTGDPTAIGPEKITVVLTRCEDLGASAEEAQTRCDETLDAVQHAASRLPRRGRLLVGTLPPLVSSFATLDKRAAETLRQRWHARLENTAGVEIFDVAEVIERLGVEQARSSQSEIISRDPFSPRALQCLAIALVRQIRRPRFSPAKVVAVDCDNTLWGGVVGEVGLEGIEIGSDGPGRSFQMFQKYLLQLKQRGLLLVVVSKNEARDVEEVFDQHPDMILRRGDIAAWRVNWRDKSQNLHDLAEQLNLALDSFVLIDDDPAVRLEVETRAPQVHVVPLPADPVRYVETLSRLWLFDGAWSTDVDLARTRMTAEEQHRQQERTAAPTLEDFFARLDLSVELNLVADRDWPRIAQLTQRTNQFNLSLKRRTREELVAFAREATVLGIRAGDRFGDYGLVGVCILKRTTRPGTAEIETLLMSCRALGRGVEDAFLHGIGLVAAEQGAVELVAPHVAGPRNNLIRDFLVRTGFEEIVPGEWTRSLQPAPALPRHVRFHLNRAEVVSAPES